jgi:hypothetical protein
MSWPARTGHESWEGLNPRCPSAELVMSGWRLPPPAGPGRTPNERGRVFALSGCARAPRLMPGMMAAHARHRAGVAQLAERQPSKPLGLCAVLPRVGPGAYRAQLCAVSVSTCGSCLLAVVCSRGNSTPSVPSCRSDSRWPVAVRASRSPVAHRSRRRSPHAAPEAGPSDRPGHHCVLQVSRHTRSVYCFRARRTERETDCSSPEAAMAS